MTKILSLGELIPGEVIKRPAASCKTPYVADVMLEDERSILAHTAALGCCGLADKSANVLMTKVVNTKNVCSHKIMLSVKKEGVNTELIGIDPSLAEKIVESCLRNNCLSSLQNLKSIKSQVTTLNSRFDFAGVDENDNEFLLEVKNVPLADYVDCCAKERKQLDTSSYEYNNKISYFPDGYRKNKKVTVSERALKHIQELTQIKKTTNKRTIMCYVIQRTDVSSFQPSVIDPIYRDAVIEGYRNGVEIIPIVCKWHTNGDCYFVTDNLKVNIETIIEIPREEIQRLQ